MPDAGRNPLDQVVDLVVYAPVGLALAAQESLPDLVAKGRDRVTAQVTLARMIGQFAVREGEREARRRFGGIGETLTALGLLPRQAPPPAASTTGPASTAPAPVQAERQAAPAPGPEAAVPPSKSNGRSRPAETEERPKAELAIPGYDTLSASQVVQRLAGLSADELDAVRSYEASTRGRRTILSKIAQLQAGPPA